MGSYYTLFIIMYMILKNREEKNQYKNSYFRQVNIFEN